MDRMIILFPAKTNEWDIIDAFKNEYAVVQEMPFFDALLFDFKSAIEEGKLELSRRPDYAKAPAMYRGPRLTPSQYKKLISASDAYGIRMITDHWRYERLHRYEFYGYRVVGETHQDFPRAACVTRDTRKTAIGHVAQYLVLHRSDGMFTKAEVDGGARVDRVVKDLDASPRLVGFLGNYSDEMLEDLKKEHLKDSDFIRSNLLFQAWIPLKKYGEFTNEWRGRFFDGRLFELLPNSGQPEDAPQPPQWLIDKHTSESPYFELDFAEVDDGDWLILGSDDGQVAGRALGQSAMHYYSFLERVARESPHLPEWIWCLVANIAEDVTHVRKDGTIGEGTKHFSPGTKIYIGSTWHSGYDGWKFVVMGKPRHQRRLIQIYMDSDKLCNFRLKKVYDKRVIEHMTRFDRGGLRLGASPESHGGWDNTDKSKKDIEEWVELLNRAYDERRAVTKEGALLEEGSS